MIVGRKLKGERKMCLTFREHELYTLVLCGNENPQICAKMDLTIGTNNVTGSIQTPRVQK